MSRRRGGGSSRADDSRIAPEPSTNSSQDDTTKEDESEICFFCENWNEELVKKTDVWISCSTCQSWWHVSCAGFEGLTQAMAKKIKNWNCHFCFVIPDRLRTAKLSNEVAKELTSVIQEAVKVSVVESIQGVIVNNVINEANKDISKTWAQIASGDATKLITEVVQVTSGPALSQSVQLIEANFAERRRKSRNIIVSNLPDSSAETESDLKELICKTVKYEIAPADIVHAKRIGSFGGTNAQSKKKYRGRLVVATLKREDDAVTLHKNGRGYAFWGATTAENVWVNPDLPKCDRDAKMLSRRAQPDRSEPAKQRRSKQDPNKEPEFVPVVKPSSVVIKPDSEIDTKKETVEEKEIVEGKEAVEEEVEVEAEVCDDNVEEIINKEVSNESQGSKNKQ